MRKLFSLCALFFLSVINCLAVEETDSTSLRNHCDFSLRSAAVGASSSIVINASLTELMKDNIRQTRPDGNGHHSFPSRHASYAFTFASILSHGLYRFSPLWVSASHTLANAVAMQRVYASRHYPVDVLAGGALGLASTELGYCISRWILPSDRCLLRLTPVFNVRSITTSTLGLVTFSSHHRGVTVGCGIESAAGMSVPLSDFFGLGATFRLRSHPVFFDGDYAGGLNGAALTADAYFCHSFGLWQASGCMSIGVIHNFDRPLDVASSFAPLFGISAEFMRRVAGGLLMGPSVGLDITNRPSALCALAAGLVIKAEF